MRNQNTDLISDENPGALSDSLESEFVRPENSYSWKGHELWPLTAGSEILIRQASGPEDSGFIEILIVIFLHLKRGEKTAIADRKLHAVPLAWLPRDEFRAAMLDWIDSLGEITEVDKFDAIEVVNKMRAPAEAAAVVPIPTPGQKKTPAKSQRKRPS